MSLIDILAQPTTLAFLGIGLGGVYAIQRLRGGGGGMSAPSIGGGAGKKSIDVLRPRDKRAFTMPINSETENVLHCPKKDKVNWRFYKSGPGYTYPNGSTKFFGIEGHAQTAVLKNDQKVEMKLPQALREIWGDVAYDKMPQNLKETLENHAWGVTISPELSEEDKKGTLSATNVDDEDDDKILKHIAKYQSGLHKFDWNTCLLGVFAGLVAGVMLVSFHVINVG